LSTSDASKYSGSYLGNGIDGQGVILGIDNDKFQRYYNGWLDIGKGATDNTWYHIRIDFECGSGNYSGLSADKWQVWIDGELFGSYDFRESFDRDDLDYLYFRTFETDSSYSSYIDAIGYAWNPNYDIGDNLNEGLLLGFENSTALDWRGYSLDGQVNKTIMGNVVFPMPIEGLHTIQVYGNDSIGTLHESEIRHFSIKPISIVTPENKTYTEPLMGYYLSTYGFENEDDGTTGTNIGFVNATLNSIQQVIPSFNGHKKVLEVFDSSGSLYSAARGDFLEQVNGTVEFWMSTDDATKYSGAYIGHKIDGQGIILKIDDNKFSRYYNGWLDIGKAATDDTWYHIRIDFECGSGNYSGLSADKWQVWIDGELFGSYDFRENFDRDVQDYLYFRTFEFDSGYSFYIDAIGYSWDPNYNIGDNLNEGLLLSFENSSVLDWMAYSLDGLANKTILGNITIQMPQEGSHSIQVFGNNSIGTMYESDIRYFSFKPINIITPENKTYSGPMSGYYPATYGFENDPSGLDPDDWTIFEGGGCSLNVIDSLGGHNKVVQLYDNGVGATNYAEIINSFSPRTSGVIEYWHRASSTEYSSFRILNDSSFALQVATSGGNWQYHNGTWQTFKVASINQWYHVKLDINCTTSSYDIYIDGVLEVDDAEFFTNIPDFNHIEIFTRGWGISDYYFYIDAVSYSWDPNYNIGDNLNEGLLLSFENSSVLDWMAYSLDGLTNKTISGNTTIQMPQGRSHSIQVFGNNSIGTMYESDIRYFSIKPINIITPENKTYTSPMSGYYPATYGFETDEDGSDPGDWVDMSGTSCDTQTIAEKSGHKKILELSDSSGSNIAQVFQNSSNAQVTGEIEWWWISDDVSKLNRFQMYASDDTQAMVIQIDSGKFQFYDSPIPTDISGVTPLNDIWYHLKLIFDCSSDTFDLYIDETLRLNNANFRNAVNDCEWLRFQTGDSDSSYSQFIDAVGFSLDPNYNIGDNLNEGLLLSFENGYAMDWQ
ncbi:MAG: hypothetical protein ACXAAH_12655, partial [Promethearchaeota archaeon]